MDELVGQKYACDRVKNTNRYFHRNYLRRQKKRSISILIVFTKCNQHDVNASKRSSAPVAQRSNAECVPYHDSIMRNPAVFYPVTPSTLNQVCIGLSSAYTKLGLKDCCVHGCHRFLSDYQRRFPPSGALLLPVQPPRPPRPPRPPPYPRPPPPPPLKRAISARRGSTC